MTTHHTPMHRAAAEAVAAHAGIAANELKVEAPPRPELGDLAGGCFAIAKARKQNPAEGARAGAAACTPGELLAGATANGPFVNFRLDRNATYRWLIDSALRGRLVPGELGAGKTICIDYGSPNTSKHLAYHHVRGTTIGHALAQMFRALGYRVVGINFLGDWGTTHGMLLAAWAKWGPVEPLDVTALNALYVRFNAAMKEDPALEAEGRAWFKRLEDGDPEARALWQRFRDVSWAEFQSVYEILGIEYDEVRGEAAYEPDLPPLLDRLPRRRHQLPRRLGHHARHAARGVGAVGPGRAARRHRAQRAVRPVQRRDEGGPCPRAGGPRVVQAARERRSRGPRAVAAVPRRVVGRVPGRLRHSRAA